MLYTIRFILSTITFKTHSNASHMYRIRLMFLMANNQVPHETHPHTDCVLCT